MIEVIKEISHPLVRGAPPEWASGWGQDQCGVWVEITVGDVVQKLRWMPPGEFLMGSPKGEKGRFPEREKQHHVTLTRGFWLFDTPVTQALWQAVTGENPSYFQSPTRPVEQVSWEDCQAFLEKINQSTGMSLSLPTEAQWEYACRAGTATATYAGNLEILGTNNAPILDKIAWYGGNSGVDFELENGLDSSDWAEKQYDHKKAGTHPVGLKEPNDWGLYDMLGNVLEWCQDWHGDYPDGAVTDPTGPETGAGRVVRGGGWFYDARYVRAAFRYWYEPGFRIDYLGFRCSQFQIEENAEAFGSWSGASKVEPAPAERGGEAAASAAAAHTDDKSGERRKRRIQELMPGWAAAIGEDPYGVWTALQIKDVEQRLRWIAPGEFLMGSPENEEGRFDREKQHHVTLTRGFWLFDTLATQALWQAVMGENPGRFKGENLPVEKVSWEDCQKFLQKINAAKGAELNLPTEAQWEYACRAGTTTATYAGDLKIEGNRAAILDGIAWYWGNSGSKTHPVGEKQPNDWGLYDMLGSVREWCQDWHGDYPDGAVIDPTGPETGAKRVFRGGGWINVARRVRAAYRNWDKPGDRSNGLGFRCSQFHPEGGDPFVQAKPSRPRRSGAARLQRAQTAATRYTVEPEHSISFKTPSQETWRIKSDQGAITMRAMTKPSWAEAIGRDRFGLWTIFRLQDLEQRLRWVPPGQFIMGSPESEQGRENNEKQHQVTLTRGFWLFDAPVTQALWQAVMGENPSRFQSPTRPVERVSWEACQDFLHKLNNMAGLRLSLPTEAQWEYACRAGTTTATHAGDLEILGQNNAPILDDIAWYAGNSGVDFELENGLDSSDWPEKQYDHKKAGTHPVGEKQPNAWGLYDMLGNVWEWCQDWHGNYPDETMVDPTGPETGAKRVIRGGSWYYSARGVRAACRDWNLPGSRYSNLGFRCSQFQIQEDDAEAAW